MLILVNNDFTHTLDIDQPSVASNVPSQVAGHAIVGIHRVWAPINFGVDLGKKEVFAPFNGVASTN